MDIQVLRGIGTLILLLTFVSFCFWLYLPSRKHYYHQAAHIPLESDSQCVHHE